MDPVREFALRFRSWIAAALHRRRLRSARDIPPPAPSDASEVATWRCCATRHAVQPSAASAKIVPWATGMAASREPSRMTPTSKTPVGASAQAGREARSATVPASTLATSVARKGTTSSAGNADSGVVAVTRSFHESTAPSSRPRRVASVGTTPSTVVEGSASVPPASRKATIVAAAIDSRLTRRNAPHQASARPSTSAPSAATR